MKTMRLCGLAALSTVLVAAPASADHSWNGYHWANSAGKVQLIVNMAVTSAWITAVSTAVSDWNTNPTSYATVLDLTTTSPNVDRKRCAAITGQILVCNAAYGPRGWLGIATISLDSKGHITKGTTKLNDTYYNTATYNTPAWRSLVACQEIGHDFGLAHQDENFDNPNLGTCMDYTSDPDGTIRGNGEKSNVQPNSHDYEELAIIYAGHLDTYNSSVPYASTNFGIREFGKAAPAAAPVDEAGDSPADWGRAVHDDGLGRPDVFVQDLPGGGRKITHVFWALETKRSDIH